MTATLQLLNTQRGNLSDTTPKNQEQRLHTPATPLKENYISNTARSGELLALLGGTHHLPSVLLSVGFSRVSVLAFDVSRNVENDVCFLLILTCFDGAIAKDDWVGLALPALPAPCCLLPGTCYLLPVSLVRGASLARERAWCRRHQRVAIHTHVGDRARGCL